MGCPGRRKHKHYFSVMAASRVSYEVLAQSAPRLTRGLPERDEGLDDEAYWAR